MEVTNVRDHVTHAVISGRKPIDFGISDSSEFFHILSSTLYSDQPLAVVREVLCNAWDAHIEAGCTDKPVEVTITDTMMTIRDFGKGIHDDDIGPIYGVYGGSTKKKNEQVTGGFGLGCKAPFAYTDHFEVISYHGGRRTLYKMTKSSAEINGKPGIVPIVSSPTDETGLEVKITLQTRNDKWLFMTLVRQIAANGEMNVLLNTEKVKTLPFSTMQHGFLITSYNPFRTDTSHRVLLRYGHVIYPVEKSEEYEGDYNAAITFLDHLPGYNGKYQIIFQAAPNTISVTPSRESLSMQDHTIKTVTKLLRDFRVLLDSCLEPERLAILRQSIADVWKKKNIAGLFSSAAGVPGMQHGYHVDTVKKHLTELPDMASHLSYCYPKSPSFRRTDLLTRLQSMLDNKFGDANLIKSYRSELLRSTRGNRIEKRQSTWLLKKVVWPLIQRFEGTGLEADRLFIYGRAEGRYWETGTTKAIAYEPKPIDQFLPYLRNIIVLARNRTEILERASNFPIMDKLGDARDLLFYTVPRNPKKIEEARNFFAGLPNVHFLDLTIYHEWEEHLKPKAKAPTPPKPKKVGLPILGSLIHAGRIRMDYLDHNNDAKYDIKRTDKPEVVAIAGRSSDTRELKGFSISASMAICALWPKKIGVAISSTQQAKYVNAGAAELTSWVIQQVCAEVRKNQKIQAAIGFDWTRVYENYFSYTTASRLLSIIWKDKELSKALGVSAELSERETQFFRIWKYIRMEPSDQELANTIKFADAIPLNPSVTKLHEKMEKNLSLLDIFDDGVIRSNLKAPDTPSTKAIKAKVREILLLALKG